MTLKRVFICVFLATLFLGAANFKNAAFNVSAMEQRGKEDKIKKVDFKAAEKEGIAQYVGTYICDKNPKSSQYKNYVKRYKFSNYGSKYYLVNVKAEGMSDTCTHIDLMNKDDFEKQLSDWTKAGKGHCEPSDDFKKQCLKYNEIYKTSAQGLKQKKYSLFEGCVREIEFGLDPSDEAYVDLYFYKP